MKEKEKEWVPLWERNITIKKYKDGEMGDYFCSCLRCKGMFIGHKMDFICGDCACEAGEELKIIGEQTK